MAKITISETQARMCVEALEFSSEFALRKGEMTVSREMRDLAGRLKDKLDRIDEKMRSSGKRP